MSDQPENQSDAYSRRQWVRAVNLSAILGWLVVAVPISMGIGGGEVRQSAGVMIWAAVIGLPIAFAVSWLIAAPILKRMMRSPITWLRAASSGAFVAFIIALVSIVMGRLRGWMQSMNPDSFSQRGGGDRIQEVDGILTTYGWLVLGQRTAVFVLAGAFIAILIRAIIGPGRKP